MGMPRRRATSMTAAISPGGERALVVVLEQERVGVGQGLACARDQPVEVGAVEQRLHLVVDPDDLLRAGDDAGLGRGGPAGDGQDEAVLQARDGEFLADGSALDIVAHSTTSRQRAPRAATLAATLAAPPSAAWRSRTVTTGTGASGLSRSVSPTR